MRRIGLTLVTCAAVLAAGHDAWADGAIRDGLGARSVGRGGTNLAFADTGVILHDNPAGMANIASPRLIEVGADLLVTDLHYADADNDARAYNNPFPMAQVSLIEQSADGVWSYGLGFFAPAGFSAQYDLEGPAPFTGTRNYKSIGSLARILPGVACRLTDDLSVGATLGVAVSHMELEGPYFLQLPGPFFGTPTMLDLQATGAAISWSVGLQYELGPRTMLGLAYQAETPMRLDGNARLEIFNVGLNSYDADFYVTWPQSLGLGVRHELCPHRILSADVLWFDWSGAFDSFDVRLTDSNGVTLPESMPLNWRDTVSVRLGYERHFCCNRVVRCGYTYHRNPIPDGTLTPYIQTTLEHAFSIGYGWAGEKLEIDLAYQYSFDHERTIGTSNFFGGDFDDARHHATAHWAFLSFLRRY